MDGSAAPDDPAQPIAGEVTCEVVIVGGGYTGMAAALRLAELGVDVVLLESAFCGSGASSRNAGHLTPTIAGDPQILATVYKRRAPELIRVGDNAVHFTESLIEGLGLECDYEPTGNVSAAPNSRATEESPTHRTDPAEVRGRCRIRRRSRVGPAADLQWWHPGAVRRSPQSGQVRARSAPRRSAVEGAGLGGEHVESIESRADGVLVTTRRGPGARRQGADRHECVLARSAISSTTDGRPPLGDPGRNRTHRHRATPRDRLDEPIRRLHPTRHSRELPAHGRGVSRLRHASGTGPEGTPR